MKGTTQRTWARASLLHERTVRALPNGASEEGAARLQTWKAKMAVDEETFRERLATNGLTESDLLHLLGDTDPAWKQGTEAQAWASALEALPSGFGQDEPLPAFTASVPGALPFYTFLLPFLRSGARQLRAGVGRLRDEYGGQLLTERVEGQLLVTLARRLHGSGSQARAGRSGRTRSDLVRLRRFPLPRTQRDSLPVYIGPAPCILVPLRGALPTRGTAQEAGLGNSGHDRSSECQ